VVDYILELAKVTEKTVTKDELQAEIAKLDEQELEPTKARADQG
jgi:trigger factor